MAHSRASLDDSVGAPPAWPTGPAMSRPRTWPAARAALIAVAIGLGLVDGCPLAREASAPGGAVGGLARARAAVLEPLQPVAEALDIDQQWVLFRSVSRRRFRLSIEGWTADAGWTSLYLAGDDAHAWNQDLLAYRRVRGAYNPYGQRIRRAYNGFARWIGDQVLAAHPEMAAARVRLERVRILPRGGLEPTGVHEFTHVRRRR
jgi:hypothetical protein